LTITNGGLVSNDYDASIGNKSGSTGTAIVDGIGSTWENRDGLHVGREGNGTLMITNGGLVSNGNDAFIGTISGSTGTVIVDGIGSIWENRGSLYVGREGDGTLDITNGGFVSVAGTLTTNYDGGYDSFVKMSQGGMLALYGDADGSLADFLALTEGNLPIRWYWEGLGWVDIEDATYGATYGVDYTLSKGDGNLAGYTILTVPEPTTLTLLVMGGLVVLRCRKGQ